MKKNLDFKFRNKRMTSKKKVEDGIYFLKGKVVVCVNGKFYKI